jgi:hypothetical protein
MAVTYTFSTQSGSIPLAQLDANFATPITIGNTSVQLGNTITTLNNITLANTTISSGNVTLTNVSVTTANVTTANITNAVIGTANVTTANITSGVIATANITTGNVGTLTLTNALGTASGGTGLSSFTSGGVVYASSTSALTTGSSLVFNGSNLGIGTSSPGATLDVNGTTRIRSDFYVYGTGDRFNVFPQAAGNGVQLLSTNNANSAYSQFLFDGSPLVFNVAGSEQMRLTSTGLGIGTSSPSFKLDVAGGVARLQQGFQVLDTDGYFAFANKTVGVTGNYGLYYSGSTSSVQIWTASSQRVTIDSSGNLTVPAMYSTTVTTPRNVFIDSTGKMGGISSTRSSKTNISQLDTASWIYELNPVTFNYLKKDEEGEYLEEFEEEQQFGLIAEEVELVKPELCIYIDDKVSGIHYDRMIAPLIKAIQELKASNDALTARIAQLEAK